MKVLREPREVQELAGDWRVAGERVAFVPTMGALHAGHLSLVEAARRSAGRCTVSIFVNPLQFDQEADLERYPRQEKQDLARLEAAGVDCVWLPTREHMYPPGFQTRVRPGVLAEQLEGACRPGHFEGVCTVVAKLLLAAGAQEAWFGAKDAQQLALVRRMVLDLNLPVEIKAGPTIRDGDGLAMSSRNRFLSPEERRRALTLSAGLAAAGQAHREGERCPRTLLACAGGPMAALDPPLVPEYLELRDPWTFGPVTEPVDQGLVLVAARLGATRLIDNLPLGERAEAYMGGPPAGA